MATIIYCSNTGSAKRYAELLSEKTGLPSVDFADRASVSADEEIIFIGSRAPCGTAFEHDREFHVILIAGAQEPFMQRISETERFAGHGLAKILPVAVPAVDEAVDPVFDRPFDLPVGDFRVCFIIITEQRGAFRIFLQIIESLVDP